MDLWMPPKPAIIIPGRHIEKPVNFKPAWLPGIAMPFAPATGVTAMSNTFTASPTLAPSLATHTYSGVSFGTADSTRRIVVSVHSSTTFSISSVTIGGVTATSHIAAAGPNSEKVAFFSALVPTGTSGTIAVTFSSAITRSGLSVWAQYNETSASPFATATNTSTTNSVAVNINVPATGSLYAGVTTSTAGGLSASTWTNATERVDQAISGSTTISYGTASESGLGSQTGRTVTDGSQTGTSPNSGMAAMTWG